MNSCPANRTVRTLQVFLVIVWTFACLSSAHAQTPIKLHQATGVVAATSPAQIVILKQFGRNTVRWTFVLNAKTNVETKPAKGARIRVFYHEDKGQRVADRVKIIEPAKPSPQPGAPKPIPAAPPPQT